MIDSTSPLKDIGLEAVSVQLETANGTAINLKLKNDQENDDAEEKSRNSEENLQAVSCITMTHRISMESYHELSMKFPQLPRSYKVSHSHNYT